MGIDRLIDTEKFSTELRRKGIDAASKRIRITKFDGSQQLEDMSIPPDCGGWGRIHHFRRSQGKGWPLNPLPIDPALRMLSLPKGDEIQVQVFQNAICSWRCWYCFVDFELLAANPKHSGFKSADELLDLYLAENNRPSVIDLSGGQPDLVPEWGLWFADALHRRGLDDEVYLWTDDNLSNDYLWRYLARSDILRLASYPNYGRVGCFKGFDEHSFSFNTSAEPSMFNGQFTLMRQLLEAEFDIYGYATFTSDDDRNIATQMSNFVDRLQSEVHPLFPLRTVPLRIYEFTPTKPRMKPMHNRALSIQSDAVQAWTEELEKRFPEAMRSKTITEIQIRM